MRAYRDPHRGAVCALLAAGCALDELPTIEVGAIADSAAQVAGRAVSVHPDAALFLRAQQLRRRFDGAADDDPLLVAPDGRLLGDRAAAGIIRTAARELGVPLHAGAIERRRPAPDRWLHRHGVLVQPLSPTTCSDKAAS